MKNEKLDMEEVKGEAASCNDELLKKAT